MAMLTVRNLSEEVHRALRQRAFQHGQSMEAEARDILAHALYPQGRMQLGSLLQQVGQQARLSPAEFAMLEQAREHSPARAASLE